MKISFLLTLVVLISCHNGQNTLQKFKAVDSSLNAKDTAKKIILRHESNIFDSASLIISKLKSELIIRDPEGEEIGLSDSLIVLNAMGVHLHNKLVRVYRIGISKTTDEKMKKNFEKMIFEDHQKWLQRFFHKIPTIAAITILNKFQADISLIEAL